jgi:hypothetical protein
MSRLYFSRRSLSTNSTSSGRGLIFNQPHPVFSVQQFHSGSDIQTVAEDHNSHCGVCSYDHGGHMGQTLASNVFVTKNILAQNTINSPLQADLWHSRNTLPKLRPPIA